MASSVRLLSPRGSTAISKAYIIRLPSVNDALFSGVQERTGAHLPFSTPRFAFSDYTQARFVSLSCNSLGTYISERNDASWLLSNLPESNSTNGKNSSTGQLVSVIDRFAVIRSSIT